MKRTIKVMTTCSMVAFVMAMGAHAGMVSGTPSSYGVIQGDLQNGGPDAWKPSDGNADRVGAGGTSPNQVINVPVWGFALPTLAAGEQIDAVNFGFTMTGTPITSSATFDAVISLMNYDQFTDFSTADYSGDIGALGNGTLVATFNNTDLAANSVESFALTGAALTLFKSFYDASGNPLQSDVWFRISHDGPWPSPYPTNDRYNFADDGTGNVTRTLDITTSVIPEPGTLGLVAAFGGGVLFIRRRFMM
ncbi:hypothetical protein PDESU_01214 [Pontiella desulfatans]|uniref:PEP-CTERM protein-sorting domain-containing protein n=1 Tax=Pontiella desulfatans TaxID=2750659 RepID=A0A6C2TZ73_PONDE|nr:PEP-CTERM sorting domain-containing protein [Pontiella desulfatans]VGO12661.1 hypothetical protein PDESU_01214 [Pontiella desulfatans]